MQANKGRDTKPELALRRELHARGLRFYVNRQPLKDSRRTADIVFSRLRIAVFVDGCFWHGCPDHRTFAKTNAEFWRAKIERTRARDVDTGARLAEQGWITVRIWEHEATPEAADRIERIVREARSEHRGR